MSANFGGWGKFYRRAFEGSMRGAGSDVYALMGYCISNSMPPHGEIEIEEGLVAFKIGMTVESLIKAIEYLTSPDPRSRTPGEDGRRLIKIGPFKYRLVNFAIYRDGTDEEARRDYFRERKRVQRARKAGITHCSTKNTPNAPEKKQIIGEYLPEALTAPDSDKGRAIRAGLCAIFERNPVDPWSYAEETALTEVVKRVNCVEELSELRNYQRANGKWFPRSIVAVLNDWTKYLDSSRSFEREPSNKPVKTLAEKETDKLLKHIKNL